MSVRETLKVKERRDDTTKTGDESRPPAREPGAYYYDDATGYDLYDPDTDEEDDESGSGSTGGGGGFTGGGGSGGSGSSGGGGSF